MIRISFIFLFIFLLSCAGLKEPKKLIDQKDDFIWSNSHESKDYTLIIDNNKNLWFNGRLIINKTDTLYLKGFEKGSNHPTEVFRTIGDSLINPSLGSIFIWTRGWNADTVELKNNHDTINFLPIYLNLYKRKK